MNIRPEHAKAVQIASDALDVPMISYDVTFSVTTRVHAHVEIDAVDIDHLTMLVQQMDLNTEVPASNWEMDSNYMEINGDEIAYVKIEEQADDGRTMLDEFEIDKRDHGEPFSWVACQLVKELAQIDKRQKKVTPKLRKLIRWAHEACATPKPLEGTDENEPSGAAQDADTKA